MKLSPAARGLLSATALYLGLALALTFPAWTQAGTRLIGDDSDSADVRESVWSLWWWGRSLTEAGGPLHITALNYPDGFDFTLYPLMSQPFLLGAALAAVSSPVIAYNVLVLASLALCGAAGYLLGAELTGDRRAGLVAGLIWAFFPAKTAHIAAGHLPLFFVAGLPLAAWGLIRLLKAPSWRRALAAALGLAAGVTIHPIYLPYVLIPLIAGMLLDAWAQMGRAFWERQRLLGLGAALGAAGLLALALAWPALRGTLTGQAAFVNATQDVIGRSPDLFAYLMPSSDHPLLQAEPLHQLAVRIVPYQYEQLTYLGLLPLALAVIGARSKESRPWVWLAVVAGVLALGPLLRAGGDFFQVSVAGERYRVVLPYAFLADLPLLQWSRTPGRLTVLLMLALAVLAALGTQRLLQTRRLAAHPYLTVGAVSLVILFEYIVRAPFPSFDAAPPAPVTALRAAADQEAVLQLPAAGYAANEQALLWQTTHGHPLIGGRIYADRPEVARSAAFYTKLLIGHQDAPGLTPELTDAQRIAALNAAGVGWVLVDKTADVSLLGPAEARLGPAQSEDERAALFKVPAAPALTAPLWVIGAGWDIQPDTWRLCDSGNLYLYLPAAATQRLSFLVSMTDVPVSLELRVNDQAAGRFFLGVFGHYVSRPVDLHAGLNILTFALSQKPPDAQPCRPAAGASALWEPVISDVRLTADAPSEAGRFGETLRLLTPAWPSTTWAGTDLALRLTWQALASGGGDLTAFVHLVDANSRLVAQHDAPPGAGAPPTSQWMAGDTVSEVVTLSLPAGLPAGTYTLQAGLYHSDTLERLPLAAGGDAVTLGTVTITP